MRVAFCGSHGTGKTTLALDVAKNHSLDYIGGMVRAIKKDVGIKINKEADIKSQTLIWQTCLVEHLYRDNFVSDRSLLDVMAYTLCLAAKESVEWEIIETAEILTQLLVPKLYDVLIYVPIAFELRADEYRDGDTKFQKEVDNKVRYLLDKPNISHYSLRNQNAFARGLEVDRLIKSKA